MCVGGCGVCFHPSHAPPPLSHTLPLARGHRHTAHSSPLPSGSLTTPTAGYASSVPLFPSMRGNPVWKASLHMARPLKPWNPSRHSRMHTRRLEPWSGAEGAPVGANGRQEGPRVRGLFPVLPHTLVAHVEHVRDHSRQGGLAPHQEAADHGAAERARDVAWTLHHGLC